MKIVTWLVMALAFGLPILKSQASHEIHVSPSAGENGDGSEASPFTKLEHARDAIRAARASGSLKSDQTLNGLAASVTGPAYRVTHKLI